MTLIAGSPLPDIIVIPTLTPRQRSARHGSEASLTRAMLKYLGTLPNSRVRKLHVGPMDSAGTPDIMLCWRGLLVMIEAKRPGADADKHQVIEMRRWRYAGAITAVCRSLADVEALLCIIRDQRAGRSWAGTAGAEYTP